MKKTIVLIVFLFIGAVSAQNLRFAWVTDIHIGNPIGATNLGLVIDSLNARNDISFVVASGDIAEKGKTSELEEAFTIFKKLRHPYYIIPGNHDTKWSESANTAFTAIFGGERFVADYNGNRFIGINSGIYWRGGGGHATPESRRWLDSVLNKTPNNTPVYFFIHHPLEPGNIDNWFKVTNSLRKKNIKAIFVGHGHSTKRYNFNGIPGFMLKASVSGAKDQGRFYGVVEIAPDSIRIFENGVGYRDARWTSIPADSSLTIPKVDSTQFVNYGVNLQWLNEMQTTFTAAPIIYKENVYVVSKSGFLFCLDSSGTARWDINLEAEVSSTPTISDDILYVATVQGDVHAINAITGAHVQAVGMEGPITSRLIVVPATYNGEKTKALLLGNSAGKLTALEVKSFVVIWENTEAQGMIESMPLYIDNKIVYGAWDGYLHCVDMATGLTNWKWSENINFYYSPAATNPVTDVSSVFVSLPDKNIAAIDLFTGKTRWKKSSFNAWESVGISADKKTVFVKSIDNVFYLVDAKTGNLKKEIPAGYGFDTVPCTPFNYAGYILFNTRSGMVYGIDASLKPKQLLFLGNSRVHQLAASQTRVVALTMDGTVAVFKLK